MRKWQPTPVFLPGEGIPWIEEPSQTQLKQLSTELKSFFHLILYPSPINFLEVSPNKGTVYSVP